MSSQFPPEKDRESYQGRKKVSMGAERAVGEV